MTHFFSVILLVTDTPLNFLPTCSQNFSDSLIVVLNRFFKGEPK